MGVRVSLEEDPSVVLEPREAVMQLDRTGRGPDALVLADKLLTELTDTHQIVGVLMAKLASLLNANRTRDCPAVIDVAWSYLQEPGSSRALLGEFHAKAADIAYRQGSLERCVTHLVRGARALDGAPADVDAMRSWLSMAVTYSYVGFHRQAVAAQRQAQKISRFQHPEHQRRTAHPEIVVRQAVAYDQQGETDRALRVLSDLLARLGPGDVTSTEVPYLAYAMARYTVLGGEWAADVHGMLRGPQPYPEYRELRQLGEAALAIGENRPRDALRLLEHERTQANHARLGRAEVPRLRSLAYTALGDDVAAHAEDRAVTRLLVEASNRLYELFVDGVTARLDLEELRRSVTRYADEAHTDALTGLPNRRHLERHVAELTARGGSGVIGVADIDRFKEVNTVHGHLVGDQVLEQVAAILTRTLRSGDFLARYGGDEFVVVLPGTSLTEAEDITRRLTSAVADHDWSATVPGTPVTLTMGLAELDGIGLAAAFRAADLLMLRAKPGRGAT